MKAYIKLELDKDDLSQELKNLVKKIASDELRQMVKEQASEMVRDEINKILHPLVIEQLTEGKFDFDNSYYSSSYKKESIDDRVKRMVVKYLNTPNYLYSRTAKKPSERYMPSSSGGEQTYLIKHIISDSINEYVDEEFAPKVREMISDIIQDKERLQIILKEQAKELVLEKMK